MADRRRSDRWSNDHKTVVKEALKEWLDDRWSSFGKWSARSLSALALVALLYFILRMNGWVRL